MERLRFMIWLILMFVIIPAIEIGLFIWTGNRIGVLPVILIIIFTGVAGIALVKQQGIETWKKVQFSMYNQEAPGEHILDGICILIGGVFLLAPGFFTDLLGFLLVIPWTRGPFKQLMYKQMVKKMNKGTIIYRKW